VAVTLPDYISENAWYDGKDQHNRVTFNGIWEAPYGLQLSGLYIFGDNGWETAQAGVDVLNQGHRSGLRAGSSAANGSVIRATVSICPRFTASTCAAEAHLVHPEVLKLMGFFEMFNVFNRTN
jgi:hypothetical protein